VSGRDPIAARFAALAPWTARFVVDGVAYGADAGYVDDTRVATFFEWFGAPATILELGLFEGAHTLQLSAPATTERVLALEGRADDVRRAELVVELHGRENVELAVEDLDTVDLARHGRFDAVFCSDVLYRLATPWRLLAAMARASDRLFLDTHYWPWPAAETVEGHAGGWVGAPEEERDGGRRSFWLTRPSLHEALTNAGWAVRHLRDHPHWPFAPRLWLGCVRPGPVPRDASEIR